VLNQYFDEGFVEDSLFQQLLVTDPPEKYLKSILGDSPGDPVSYQGRIEHGPVRFTGFILSEKTYNEIDEQISQMIIQGGYLNLAEILPNCFREKN